jgi:homoserine dehydrogenase
LLAIARGNAGEDSDRLELRVHPTLVPQSHPLASINGVNNAILVEGDPLGQVMFYGPGAGSGPTASAVVSDIMNIVAILKSYGSGATLDPLLSRTHQHYCQITPIEEIKSSFYTRLITLDRPGAIGQIGTCFGENNVSLQSLVQNGLEAGQAELVVVSHNVKEQFFRQALESIKQLEAIKSIPSVIRVLE